MTFIEAEEEVKKNMLMFSAAVFLCVLALGMDT